MLNLGWPVSRRAAFLLASLACSVASAEEPARARDAQGSETAEEEDSQGFAAPVATPQPATPSLRDTTGRTLLAGGYLRSEVGLWLERLSGNPLEKARQSVDINARYVWGNRRLVASLYAARDLAYLHQRQDYDRTTLDEYETRVFARELFARWSPGIFELSVGKQIVARGVGTVLSPIDSIGPRDDREPGLAALDDLRLGVWASRASLSWSDQRLELMFVHRADFGLRSPIFGPFNSLATLFGGSYRALNALSPAPIDNLVMVHRPRGWGVRSQQMLGRWSLASAGLDLEVYAGSVRDQFGVFHQLLRSPLPGVLDFEVEHLRYTLLATAGSMPLGSWLLEWELAAEIGRSFDVASQSFASGLPSRRRTTLLTGMAGVRYSGLPDGLLTLELTHGEVLKDIGALLFPFDQPALALRYQHTLRANLLEVRAQFIGFGSELQFGAIGHLELEYALTDAWHAMLGYATYQPGSEFGFIAGFERHDLLLSSLRYDFLLD
ncbi:MAG: hypothetical protein ABI895_10760 [Deltaproteobacteria bacterium]